MEFRCNSGCADTLFVSFTENCPGVPEVIISIDETDQLDELDRPNVILTPEDALALAIKLMDWARQHMEDLPYLGDFGVQEAVADAEEYLSGLGFDAPEECDCFLCRMST